MLETHQETPLGLTGPSDEPNQDDWLISDMTLRQSCPRFRILIIGKANAGKTTILQKMCNTTDTPILHDHRGRKLDASILEDPAQERGKHDIENEITYLRNPGFVFHDSCGFEAASTAEVDNVTSFIANRSAARSLEGQLHAIWYCLPTDNDRPLSSTEISFFERGTGNVPVIAIFTKFDAMDGKEYQKLRDKGMSIRQARAAARHEADRVFEENHLKRINVTQYPPVRYVCLRSMHKPESECHELTEKTAEAVTNTVLRRLLVSVQQSNINLCIKYALDE